MPSPKTLPGFILKKEACAVYKRSLRQLTRDFDKATAKGNSEFLANFKLALEDGTIMDASETTKGEIQKFRDSGLNPTWFVRESWMQETYGRRDETDKRPALEQTGEADEAEPRTSPTTREEGSKGNEVAPTEIIESKDELISVLREEVSFLRDQLKNESQRSAEDKELMRQTNVLFKNLQDRLLPEANPKQPITLPKASPARASDSVDVTETETADRPVRKKPTRRKATGGGKKTKPSTPSRSRKQDTKTEPKTKASDSTRIEKLFPTFSKFLRSK